jgi:hypothetical protein
MRAASRARRRRRARGPPDAATQERRRKWTACQPRGSAAAWRETCRLDRVGRRLSVKNRDLTCSGVSRTIAEATPVARQRRTEEADGVTALSISKGCRVVCHSRTLWTLRARLIVQIVKSQDLTCSAWLHHLAVRAGAMVGVRGSLLTCSGCHSSSVFWRLPFPKNSQHNLAPATRSPPPKIANATWVFRETSRSPKISSASMKKSARHKPNKTRYLFPTDLKSLFIRSCIT